MARRRKILFVSDSNKNVQRLLKSTLKGKGYQVIALGGAEDVLAKARSGRPDIVLLEAALRSMDGLELLSILRRESDAPILLLTERKAPLDLLLGFRLGADDCIARPFAAEELLARIEAVLRRSKARSKQPWPGPIRLGRLFVHLDAYEVALGRRRLSLTPKEQGILKLLIEADGRVVARKKFLERVWGYDRDCEITTRTVDQNVARLRKKLRREGGRIAMVRGCGYRLRNEARREP